MKCLSEAFAAHSFTAALKLVKVGLLVRLCCKGCFAAEVASLSAFLLPATTLCPGHQRRVILSRGLRFSILLMSCVARILCERALDDVFFVDMSLTTP